MPCLQSRAVPRPSVYRGSMSSGSTSSTLVWLRDDLRLDDNPALAEAAELGYPLTVVYVLDEASPGVRPLGGAARWWLHHSLTQLAAGLEAAGSRLLLRRGPAAGIIQDIAAETGATAPALEPPLWGTRTRHRRRRQGLGGGARPQGSELPGQPAVRALDGADRGRQPVQGLHALLEGVPERSRAPPSPGGAATAARARTRRRRGAPGQRAPSQAGTCSPAAGLERRTRQDLDAGRSRCPQPARGLPGRPGSGIRHRPGHPGRRGDQPALAAPAFRRNQPVPGLA